MPILPKVGRRSARIRGVITCLYAVLVLGSITMLYPFGLMISRSFSNKIDRTANEFSLVPQWFFDREVRYQTFLFRKYLFAVDKTDALNRRYGTSHGELADVPLPGIAGREDYLRQRVKDWHQFKALLPPDHLGYFDYLGYVPLLYQRHMQEKFGSIEAYNQAYHEEKKGFQFVAVPVERYDSPIWTPPDTRQMRDWIEFKKTLSPAHRIITAIDPVWQGFLKLKYKFVDRLNSAYGTSYDSFGEIFIPPRVPAGSTQRADWEEFVRTQFPVRYMSFPQEPDRDAAIAKWRAGKIPPEQVVLANPENLYRQFLLDRHGSIPDLNRAHGTEYRSIIEIRPPRMEEDLIEFEDWTLSDFVKQVFWNYAQALNQLFLQKRAFLNTAILCLGAVLSALIVNPLCAYALSRFNLSYAHRILLFCLATMAFPAEVTMIPNFLLMRDLHLLNTYWALILPTMANGFSIFILKGFFDSLPDTLFEAAQLDGASELRMFRDISVPLSAPVLAVIAITTFTLAYGSFMWAFVVCQDPNYWTVMVYVYQLQQTLEYGGLMALLVVTALPTLIVFIFCQRIILRGIVVPTMR
jgi:multiple sugar transport system permease protein